MDKILLVEDHEAQRLLYHEELVEEGYEVVVAKNGFFRFFAFEEDVERTIRKEDQRER